MTFIDLFSGIGGFRRGLERSGYKCVGHVEIDKFANKSYCAMYDLTPCKFQENRRLSELTGLSMVTISKNMRLLERKGYIQIIHRTTCDGGWASNKYVLNLDKLYS